MLPCLPAWPHPALNSFPPPLSPPQDAMHYFVDNLFRPDKAPYCSNCSRDADCIALLLVGAGKG